MSIRYIKQSVVIVFTALSLALLIADQKTTSANDSSLITAVEFAWLNTQQAENRDKPAEKEKTAEEVYKNIQIFQGLPASRLMGAMTNIAKFIGVDCTHCHIQGEFEKDDKPTKQTARKMFQMVRLASRELNTNRVTCYTCHRGKPQPERPELPPGMSKEQVEEMMKQGEQDKRPAEQVYKNIQTLKGVPAGRWMMIMTMFTKSLGVDCTHCHVQNEFEKDDKPAKQTARKMLRLTGSIAREIYKGPTSINCYTCHRGQAQPVSLPAATQSTQQKSEIKSPEITSSGTMPTVDQVLEKYIRAIGGKAAFRKFPTRVMKGSLETQGGTSMPLEIYIKAPNKLLTSFSNPGGMNLMGFDGVSGWTETPETGFREVTGPELIRRKAEAGFYKDFDLRAVYSKMILLGKAKFDDREAYAIEGLLAEGDTDTMYFDTQTGLLLRMDSVMQGPQGGRSIVTYFEDYKEVDNIKLPFLIRRSRPGFTWSYKFTEVKHNVSIDDEKFNRPMKK